MVQGTRSLRRGELLAILGEIFRNKETGTLVLQQGSVSKFLYAQEGFLIFAASNAPEDKFTQILIDKGKLTAEQLAMAQEKKESRTIGRTLVELGFLGSEDLLDALVNQMRKIADSVANWEMGVAAFKPGILPPNLAKLPISTPRFILDTALTVEDREWAAGSLGHLEDVLDIAEADREMARALSLSQEESRVLESIDGTSNAREICLKSDVNLFAGVRFLIGLHELGWIAVEPSLGQAPQEQPFEAEAPPLLPPPSKAAKEAVDLSFLDKVTPASHSSRDHEELPESPFEVREVPSLPPKPPSLFEGQEETPPPFVPVKAPPTPRVVAPDVNVDLPPRGGGVASSEMSFPDLVTPGEYQQGAGAQQRNLATPQVPLPSFMQEAEPPKKRFSWALVAIAGTGVLAVGAVVVFAVWYLFLRQSPFVPVPPTPGPKKPLPVANQTTPAKPPLPKPPANEPVVTPPANTVTPPANTVTPPKEPANTAKPVVTPPANTAVPPKEPANTTVPPKKPEPTPPPAKPETPAPEGDARDLLDQGRYDEAARAFQGEMQSKRGGFTINVEIACQPETVAKGIAAAGGHKNFMILPYNLKGRSCYRVIWGHYADKASADEALGNLPAFFKAGASPQVAPWK